MNILFIVSWYEKYHSETITTGVFHNEQARKLLRDHKVVIWFPFDTTICEEMTCEEEWGVMTVRTRRAGGRLSWYKDSFQYYKKIRAFFPVDLIHAHVAASAGEIGALLGKVFHIPYMITEHSPLEMMELEHLKTRIKQKMVYTGSRANVCVSNDLKIKLQERFPECRFETIYNGVADPRRMIAELTEDVRYRQDGTVNAVIVASFYNKEVKGFQFLLPAIQQINAKREKQLHLHICGDGEFLQHYVKMADELKIKQYCSFYGNCEKKKLYSIISQMDFGISASLFESAGVSIEEILMLGKPVIVTRSGGVSSLVSEDNSIIVEPGSTSELTKGISEMMDRYPSYSSGTIRGKACKTFEIDEITEQYSALYRKVLHLQS